MSEFRDNLIKDTNYFFEGDYDVIDGRGIPVVEDLIFGIQGKKVELAMLFIDIKESTKIVDAFRLTTSARMYQAFLRGITLIALKNDGEVRSFNGDGVLITFFGDLKCNNAVRTALQMMDFVNTVLKPKINAYFNRNKQADDLFFDCGIGIDVGDVLVVRGGAKGDNNNDLVWVGNATNFAVKLSAQTKREIETSDGRKTIKYNIHITNRVFNNLKPELKTMKGTLLLSTPIWQKYSVGLLLGLSESNFRYRTNKTLPF